MNDTIVALATPPGIGGIAVLRLSGPEAWQIAEDAKTQRREEAKTEPNTAHFVRIEREGQLIDEAVMTFFRAPRSYTGEDVVEISCHGGRYAAARVLELILQAGARMARPGEFTERAFLNNKLDLAQAEAVAGIIHARTHRAGQAAARQLAGGLSEKVRAMRGRLLDLLALLELELDFSDEDVEFESLQHRRDTLSELQGEMRSLTDTFQRGRVVREGLRVAIVGTPNAGKSTLLNALAREDRAIVSPEPGTTRDVVEAHIEVEGIELILQDTAGLREAEGAIESAGIERTQKTTARADVVLLVVDYTDPHWKMNLPQDIMKSGKTILVLNKTDLIPKPNTPPKPPSPFTAKMLEYKCRDYVESAEVSALTGEGIERLLHLVVTKVIGEDIGNEEIVISESRHHDALTRAMESLSRAETQLKAPTLMASDLRDTVNALGEITGETVGEEILDRIFSQFCIGK